MTRLSDERLVAEIRTAYDRAAQGWATGPAALYRSLAVALVGTAEGALHGQRVLDLGTGTGVASDVLIAAGAQPVGVDLAPAMLAHRQSDRPPGVAGDARALPFRDGVFDAVVAAFSLNHVPDPGAALGECRRVTRSGGIVLASSFPSDADHPAKAVVEEVLACFGYQRPAWYQAFKDHVAVRTGDAAALAGAAAGAGLTSVRVERLLVEAGADRPERAVEWRLAMPHTMGFVAALDPRTRMALREQATAALSGTLPSSVPILVLRADVPRGPWADTRGVTSCSDRSVRRCGG